MPLSLPSLPPSTGMDTYVNDECFNRLATFFEPESIAVKSFQQKYCNYNKLTWIFYYKHIRDLLLQKDKYWKGKLIYLWPNTGKETKYSGYGTDAHYCPEHERLMQRYIINVRRTLRFRKKIVDRVNEIMDAVAKKMDLPRSQGRNEGLWNSKLCFGTGKIQRLSGLFCKGNTVL